MRGLKVESRYYECEYGRFHLTSESRSSYENRNGIREVAQW
ncbi:hypothetical protein [Streptomyces mirabilis]